MVKSNTFSCFYTFHAYTECYLSVKLVELCNDKGGEYMGHDFVDYCCQHEIVHQHTETAEPYQDSVAEHDNCTIAEGGSRFSMKCIYP